MSAEHRCIAEQTHPLCQVSVVRCMSPVRSPYILWRDPDHYGKTVAEKRKEYYVQEEQITKTNNIYYVGQFP